MSLSESYPRIWRVLSPFLADHSLPGGSIAVTHKGSVVLGAAFGHFTYDPGSSSVQADTVYDVASLTKVLATTPMAMLLYERGKLRLDSGIAEVIPEFLTDDLRRQRVSFRMLLAHSSGLPAYARLFEEVDSREELLQRCFTMPLEAEPGARAEYSDIGFILLGETLERLAGESLDRFCHREVLAPLRMQKSIFCPSEQHCTSFPPTENDVTFRKRVIQGEVNDENAWVMGGVAGHAGLFAPAGDVAKFALCTLGGGEPLFRSETIELFTARQDAPANSSRALGWDTVSSPSQAGQYFSSRSYGHLGFTGTSLWIDPERDLSITLLTNRTWPDRSAQGIKQLRPALHNAIIESLDLL